jgi:hypothetical protein
MTPVYRGYTGCMEVREPHERSFPMEVPLKVIGNATELRALQIAEVIHEHLGKHLSAALPETWERDYRYSAHNKGAWISHTFWVALPHENAERPLREAIQKLSGVVMQL